MLDFKSIPEKKNVAGAELMNVLQFIKLQKKKEKRKTDPVWLAYAGVY